MIYTELNVHSFAYELSRNKDNGFSYKGAETLYDYLEGMGIDIEFDNVALRSEFTEYEDIQEYIKEYGLEEEASEIDSEDLFDDLIRDSDYFIGGEEDCFIMSIQ